ncbi:GNAT family N-acetyltransferase [Neisseria sp. Ec49-e6-T10]|uniref:GNAT family N-acetyltransferase n=1 Tax=Neisseria sp. Ec49-e6-T10 TaxID=3140744 RepID=UPI003EBF05B5
MVIRSEEKGDEQVIDQLLLDAFKDQPYSNNTENQMVQKLRQDNGVTLALVAGYKDEIIGYIAFSKIVIDNQLSDWEALAPVSVSPQWQNKGIGRQLIEEGLKILKGRLVSGCVLVGFPEYYKRFGFRTTNQLKVDGIPPEYFMVLPFNKSIPVGTVEFHSAFLSDN